MADRSIGQDSDGTTRALKVLFITQYFYPEIFSNNKVVANLVARGHDVTVISAIPNYPKGRFFDGYGFFKRKHETYEGARIERVSVIPRGSRSLQLVLNYLSFVITASFKCLFMRRRTHDLVLCSAPSPVTIAIPGIVAGWRMGCPTGLWLQDLWPQTVVELLNIKSGFARRALDGLCRWIYRHLDLILVPSQGFVAELNTYAGATPIVFFPNTIEDMHAPVPTRTDLRDTLALSSSDFICMFAGNIGTAQNVDVLIDAARIVGDPRLQIVLLGDGRDRARLETRIAEEGLATQFHFIGSVPPDMVPQHLSYADAAVLTLRDEPAFHPVVPYRVQAFLGCGKMILASIGGEVGRIVQEADCGYVAPPGDAPAMAKIMRQALALDVDEVASKGANARTYAVKHYDETQVMNDLENNLMTMLKRGSA